MFAKYAAKVSVLNPSAAAQHFGGDPVSPVVTQTHLIRGLWKRWSDRRTLAAAVARMAQTAPHLLEDIGIADEAHPPLRRRQHLAPVDRAALNEEQLVYALAAE